MLPSARCLYVFITAPAFGNCRFIPASHCSGAVIWISRAAPLTAAQRGAVRLNRSILKSAIGNSVDW